VSRLALACLVACGCSTGSTAPRDGGATGDLAGADLAHGLAGVACGAASCLTFSEFCCTADRGVTGTCDQTSNPSCGDTLFLCDGPEDCPPASPECCVSGGEAQCRPFGECATLGVEYAILCHGQPACGTGNCCPAPNGSPYSICFATLCP
jgi:hypothetical protein